jgi:hypothetical protein
MTPVLRKSLADTFLNKQFRMPTLNMGAGFKNVIGDKLV